jgi:hypothetical protein
MTNGAPSITINPQEASLYNDDGSVKLLLLGADLSHEGQHLVDAINFNWKNGAQALDQERATERNAYAAQSYFDLAENFHQGYYFNGSLAMTPLTPSTANQFAELSVQSWWTATNISISNTNAINDRNAKLYNQKYGTHISRPHIPPMQWVPPSK